VSYEQLSLDYEQFCLANEQFPASYEHFRPANEQLSHSYEHLADRGLIHSALL